MHTTANRGNRLTLALLSFFLIFAVLVLIGRYMNSNQSSSSHAMSGFTSSGGPDHVALIHIEGPITASAGGGAVFGSAVASSDNICKLLYQAKDDESIKAVLLRINSPGGSAAASDEIYRAVMAVRKAKKPVVVSMGDVAASGGYYISSAADYIYANGATLTGSIGVIFELINWQELAKKAGVKSETLHAGEFKDIGSPWRDMTATEKDMMTGLLKQVHDQFIHAVDEGRTGLDEAAVRKLATGMVYTGEKAKELGLIDEVGGQHDAEAKVRSLAHLDADAEIEEYGAVSLWDEIFSAKSQAPLPGALANPALQQSVDPLTLLAAGLFLNTTLQNLQLR